MRAYIRDIFEKSNTDDNQLFGIRAISCFLVIVIHTFHFAQNQVTGLHPFVLNYIQNLEFIMDIFFLMSAYLVSASFLKDKDRIGFFPSWKAFIQKRSFRIFPLFLCILGIYIIAWRFSLEIAAKTGNLESNQLESGYNMAWYSDLFYFSNYFSNRLLAHGWSLSLEEQFYLILPFLILFITKINKEQILRSILFVILTTTIFLRFFVFSNEVTFNFEVYKKTIFEPTHTRFEPFVLGVFLAIVRVNRKKIFTFEGNQLHFWLLVSTLLLLVFNAFTIEEIPFLFYTIRITLFSFFSFFLIYFTLENRKENRFKKFLSNPIFVPIGKLSYGIYLIHFPIVILILEKFKNGTNLNEFGYVKLFVSSFISLFVTFILAWIAYLIIEKPFIRMREWTNLRFDIKKNTFYANPINRSEFPIVIILLNLSIFLPYLFSLALIKLNFFFGASGGSISKLLLIVPICLLTYYFIRYRKDPFTYFVTIKQNLHEK